MLRTSELSKEAADSLRELMITSNSLDFWKEPRTGHNVDINTPPELIESLKEMLANKGVEVSVMIDDVEK